MTRPQQLPPIAPELRSAFEEIMAMHELARLSEAGVVRVLKTIPHAILRRALAE
jgi:hypothetical protein